MQLLEVARRPRWNNYVTILAMYFQIKREDRFAYTSVDNGCACFRGAVQLRDATLYMSLDTETSVLTGTHSKLLPLYYWRPSRRHYGTVFNFGDSLFPLLAERIVGHPIRTVGKYYPFQKLLAGGSIINGFARNGDVVWGAGLHHSDAMKAERLDVRAVRGPLTQQTLQRRWGIACPEIYGDPALLTPDLFPEWQPMPVKGLIGLVPHLRNRKKYRDLPSYIKLILPTRPPHQVIPEILQCELIISGSLHGLIIAEAYGIPARWFPDDGGEPEFKYHDYYASTNRTPHPADSLHHAEDLGGQEGGAPPDKDRLISAFPKRC